MARVLNFLIRYFSNYNTLHRSDLAARAVPLDPRLLLAQLTDFILLEAAHQPQFPCPKVSRITGKEKLVCGQTSILAVSLRRSEYFARE